MKVLAGRLTDEDRALVFRSNAEGIKLLIATERATVTYDQRRATPYERAPMQAVGVVTTYDHDTLTIGGWSFSTVIPWVYAVKVWRREDAPSEAEVDALIAAPLGDGTPASPSASAPHQRGTSS